jgi:hypothetical protein
MAYFFSLRVAKSFLILITTTLIPTLLNLLNKQTIKNWQNYCYREDEKESLTHYNTRV